MGIVGEEEEEAGEEEGATEGQRAGQAAGWEPRKGELLAEGRALVTSGANAKENEEQE